jgi:hypothetical protein
MTPTSGFQIVLGKALGAIAGVWPMLLLLLIFGPLVYISGSPVLAFAGPPVILTFGLALFWLFACIGVSVSVVCKRRQTAVTVSVALCGLATVGVAPISQLASLVLDGSLLGPIFVLHTMLMSPMMAIKFMLREVHFFHVARAPLQFWLVYLAFHFFVGWALLHLAALALDRRNEWYAG